MSSLSSVQILLCQKPFCWHSSKFILQIYVTDVGLISDALSYTVFPYAEIHAQNKTSILSWSITHLSLGPKLKFQEIKVSGSIQWNVLKHSELTIMHQIFCLSKVTRWNIDRFIIKQTCTSILFIYTLPRYRHHLNHCWIVDGLARRGLPHPTTFAHCWRKIWSHTRMR